MQYLWCLVPQQAQQQLLVIQEDAVQSPAAQASHAPSTPSVAPLKAAGNSPLGESPCSPEANVVHPDQAPVQPVGGGSQIAVTDASLFNKESPAVHQVEHQPLLKRRLREEQEDAKIQPAWKKRRVQQQQQQQHRDKEPKRHDQQQQQQHEAQHSACNGQTMPLSLQEDVVDSILNSIMQLGYLHSDKFGSQRLSPHHRAQLRAQPLLVQLRFLASLATGYEPDRRHVNGFCSAVLPHDMDICQKHNWLSWRIGAISTRHLSDKAQSVRDQLCERNMLLQDDVPEVTAEVLPEELQAAYVLCLGGYQGPKPLAEFAATVLQDIARQVLNDSLTSAPSKAQQLAACSLILAAEALAAVHNATQSPAQGLPDTSVAAEGGAFEDEPDTCADAGDHEELTSRVAPLDMQEVHRQVLCALRKLKHLTFKAFLQQLCDREWPYDKPVLQQLLVLSKYCAQAQSQGHLEGFMQSQWEQQQSDRPDQAYSYALLAKRTCAFSGHPWCLRNAASKVLSSAQDLGQLTAESQHNIAGIIVFLPPPLHCVAACYAIQTYAMRKDHNEYVLLNNFMASLQQELSNAFL